MFMKLLLSLPLLLRLALTKPIHHAPEDKRQFRGPPGHGRPGFRPPHDGPPNLPPHVITTPPFTGSPASTTTDSEASPLPSTSCVTTVRSTRGETCKQIANKYGVAYSPAEGDSQATSQTCKALLSHYNICVAGLSSLGASSTTPVLTSSSSQLASSTSVSDTTFTLMTAFTTMTYTLGAGTSTRVTSIVITRTVTDTVTISSSSSVSIVPASAPATVSSSSIGNVSSSTVVNVTSSSVANISSTPSIRSTPVASSTTNFTTTVPNTTTSTYTPSSSSAAPTATTSPDDKYVSYCGDGSTAAGWPDESQWKDFDYLFDYNTPTMQTSCAAWGVPNDSHEEIANMRSSIISISEQTQIDPRFILAVIMQESTGCVRVITTAYSHDNPGLMQSFNGSGTCNTNNAPLGVPGVDGSGTVQTPCPQQEIHQQILDGTAGTQWGPGLEQDYKSATTPGAEAAQIYYRTARIYNGGSYVATDLSQPCCTTSYVSDIANRLMGWVHAPREYTCGS